MFKIKYIVIVGFCFAAALFVNISFANKTLNSSSVRESITKFKDKFSSARIILQRDNETIKIVNNFATTPIDGNLEDGAKNFVMANSELFGLSSDGDDLRLDRVVGYLDEKFIRFHQVSYGYSVFDHGIIVRINGERKITQISSSVVLGLTKKIMPRVSEQDAINALKDNNSYLGDSYKITLGLNSLNGNIGLLYRIYSSAPENKILKTFVNAKTGRVVFQRDIVLHHDANIFLENSVIDEDTTVLRSLENLLREGEHINHTYGTFVRVVSCLSLNKRKCTQWQNSALATETAGFTDIVPSVDEPASANNAFSEIMAYYHLNDQQVFMRNEFGYTGTYFSQEDDEEHDYVMAFVNAYYNNAHWYNGSLIGESDAIVMGYMENNSFAYDSDITVHEFTHSVSAKAMNIGYLIPDEYGVNLTASGMEEGNADYWACSRHDNSIVGEYAGSLRDIDNEKKCPNDLMGESHHDGLIFSGATWKIRQLIGQRMADHLIYQTLAGHDIGNFDKFYDAVMSEASVMQLQSTYFKLTAQEVAEIGDILDASNMKQCVRAIPLYQDGEIQRLHFYVGNPIFSHGTPGSVQYKISSGENPKSLSFYLKPASGASYEVLISAKQPVMFNWRHDYTWTAKYDYSVKMPFDLLGSAIIDSDSKLKIEPNTDYYFAVVCRGTDICNATVTYFEVLGDNTDTGIISDSGVDENDNNSGADAASDTDADADADAADTAVVDDDGCGCLLTGKYNFETNLLNLIFD